MPGSAEITARLAAFAAALQPARAESALANDMFEAADDWRDLGQRLSCDADRLDVWARVSQEQALLRRLRAAVAQTAPAVQARYQPILDAGGEIIAAAAAHQRDPDGHLGFLRVIRETFAFLVARGFACVATTQISASFSSGQVFVRLECAAEPWASCTVGPEGDVDQRYYLDDLLSLAGDPAWQSLPQKLSLRSQSDVEQWFSYVAHVLRNGASDIMANTPGIFPRLPAPTK